MKPYYQDSSVTIYHGDMREIVPSLETVDAIITDPPYGETSLEWDVWPSNWPNLLWNLSRQMWVFGSMRMFWERSAEFEGWRLAQDIIWEKHNGSGIHNDRFRRVHELALHLYRGEWRELYIKTPKVDTGDPRRGMIKKRTVKPKHFGGIEGDSAYTYDGTRFQKSVIRVNSCHGMAVHPTQKPEGIILPLMDYSVPPSGIVLDPFMGSGTVLRVAKDRGGRAIGIEKNESYCEAAARRMAQGALNLTAVNQ